MNGILHIMALKLMLLKLLLVEDLELEMVKSIKMTKILIPYLMHIIINVEKEFIVHLLFMKLKAMAVELRLKIKNIILLLCVELIHIMLDFVKITPIIGLFLEIILLIKMQRNMILK